MTRHHSCRVSPFGHPRIHARLTAPRGISQPPTSFIGSQCQGIHHAPLNTYNTKPQNELQNQKNCTSTHNTTRNPQGPQPHCVPDARNHYPQIKHHTPPPKREATTHPLPPTGQDHRPVVSKPNSVLSGSITSALPRRLNVCHLHPPDTHYRPWLKNPNRTTAHDLADGGGTQTVLLRKEVIQPHLPVRLPCYDFVPIADPTFDSSLPKGLGHWLRVLPTFMT